MNQMKIIKYKNMDLNRVMIIGRVVQKPELRTTSTGQSVATFTVATNKSWTDKNGQKHEDVEFHNIVAWGNLAGICDTYLDKGKRVYIEGSLKTNSWVGKDGQTRYKTETNASNMIMLDRTPTDSNGYEELETGVDKIPF